MNEKRLVDIGDGRIVEMTEMGVLTNIPIPKEPKIKNPGARKDKRKKSLHGKKYKGMSPYAGRGGHATKRDHVPGYAEWLSKRRTQVFTYMVEDGLRSRKNVPDGMRREEAERLWAIAREKAKKDMANLKKAGIIDASEDRAEQAMVATLEIMHSPMNQQMKLAAAKQVLEWTKAKPAAKTEMTVNAAEAWLASLAEDDGSKAE